MASQYNVTTAEVRRANATQDAALGHSPTGEWWRVLVRVAGERRARSSGWFATREEAEALAGSTLRIYTTAGGQRVTIPE